MDNDNLVSTFLNPIFVRTVELLFTKVKKTLHSYFGSPGLSLCHMNLGFHGFDSLATTIIFLVEELEEFTILKLMIYSPLCRGYQSV